MKTNKKKEEELLEEMPKSLTTYLGQKGYTLLKKELTVKQQYTIKEKLMVKPFTHGAPMTATTTFPVYRESENKLYVPRYFGEHYFGEAKQIKIPEGDNIDLTFEGKLRDYQEEVVYKFIDYVKSKNTLGGLLELYCAWGKTSASLYIISQLKKKTIVIVHKEFLMNQWIERIQQFLPSARIGKIQGQTIDIEDKDIVLCMLQSLVLKEYPPTMFDSFGLTIIDEVHHISSQTFSNALFKLVTKYMLGLSATMQRKDGTTDVFKMFLGKIVHTAIKKVEHEVEVRAITYKTNDDDFNETILDYKGQPQISSMISKLCSYNRRTEFIIKTLNDFLCVDGVDPTMIRHHKETMDKTQPACKMCKKSDNYLMKNTCCNVVEYCLLCMDNLVEQSKTPIISIDKKTGQTKQVKRRPKCPSCNKVLSYEQHYIENPYVKPIEQLHIIIMSHNLNILEYMYRKLVCKNYASVGYYVGGMSEHELKRSEKKQVILSSYQMASEGLDIATLNTEFLISPKTDVVQIVGRILRAKHATNKPIIYDFVDSHDVFHKQWLKRKTYYKKQNYKIIETNSSDYQKDTSKWKIGFLPNNSIFEKKCQEEDEIDLPMNGCLLLLRK